MCTFADEIGNFPRDAETEGISMQDAARRAVREYVAREHDHDRVDAAGERIIVAHRDALDRLGE